MAKGRPRDAPSRSLPADTGLRVTEMDVLWITAGLGCDGDTIAMTAATQPSLEDMMFGALPWIPKVKFHNPVSRLRKWRRFPRRLSIDAAEGKLSPFILVVEGSIPNETNKAGRLLGLLRDRPRDRAADHDLRMDRPAGAQGLGVVAAGTCATYGGIHAMQGNPTGCMGLPDYLGWQWKSSAGIPIVCVPGCPVAARQHDGDAAVPAAPGGWDARR